MSKVRLLSIAATLALTSSVMAAELSLLSNLSITGDARVRGISTSGISAANAKEKETIDSRIRLNLDSETEGGVKIHSRIKLDNDTWGNNGDDTFTWDEASVLLPLTDSFLYAGRVNDTYGTKFYGSHNDKIDLAFLGYTGIENVLLYAFDYKAVEGAYNSDSGQLGLSTGGGDYDAYAVGGQITIDEMLIGGRYASLQDNRSDDAGVTFRDTEGSFLDAFAIGKIAGLEVEAQIQQNSGNKYNTTTNSQVDSEALGIYLNLGKQFDGLRIGGIAISTEDGYTSGGDLRASYLTSPTNGGIATLGRVGGYGDTNMFSAQVKYDITDKISIEGIFASQSIDKATINSFNKDLEIMEYDIGLEYKYDKNVTFQLQYAYGDFDTSELEDINNIYYAININF